MYLERPDNILEPIRTNMMETKDIIMNYRIEPWQESLPVTLAERVEAKLISNLSSIHCIRKILFVSKYKQHCITQFVLKTNGIRLSSLIHHIQTSEAENDKKKKAFEDSDADGKENFIQTRDRYLGQQNSSL